MYLSNKQRKKQRFPLTLLQQPSFGQTYNKTARKRPQIDAPFKLPTQQLRVSGNWVDPGELQYASLDFISVPTSYRIRRSPKIYARINIETKCKKRESWCILVRRLHAKKRKRKTQKGWSTIRRNLRSRLDRRRLTYLPSKPWLNSWSA